MELECPPNCSPKDWKEEHERDMLWRAMYSAPGTLTPYFPFLMIYYLCCYSCPKFPPSPQPISYFHSQSHTFVLIHGPSYIFFAYPFTLFQSVPSSLLPSYHCQSISRFYAYESILLISVFCSLDSSYKWVHIHFFSPTGLFHLEQGCHTHFHQEPHQPRGCLQRADIILGLYKCNYSLTRGKELSTAAG